MTSVAVGYAVGVTITVCALVWLFFELRAYKRLRIFTYDPARRRRAARSGGPHVSQNRVRHGTVRPARRPALQPVAAGAGNPPRELTSEEKAEELRAFNTREQDAAWRSVAYLISGPLVYGGIGYLLDRWLGTTWIVGVGIVGGMALSLYLIWFRYGSH